MGVRLSGWIAAGLAAAIAGCQPTPNSAATTEQHVSTPAPAAGSAAPAQVAQNQTFMDHDLKPAPDVPAPTPSGVVPRWPQTQPAAAHP